MALEKPILTQDEVWALVRACGRGRFAHRDRAMIITMWRTGARVHELVSIRTYDVDLKARRLTLQTTKGDRVRTIPLDNIVIEALQTWIDVRKTLGIRVRALFCTRTGKPVHPQFLRNRLPRLAARAGIAKRVHPHAFRHTFAVELDRSRVPLAVVSELLGHSHASTTSVYLTRHGSDQASRAIQARYTASLVQGRK